MVCDTCFAESDMLVASEDCVGVFGEGTRLAMPKTICAPDSSSLKPGSGGTDGVQDYRDLGHPAYWTSAGLMGCEDTRPNTLTRVRIGLSLAWMASLAFGYEDSFLYNRLCTTLVPSGVYINRRI